MRSEWVRKSIALYHANSRRRILITALLIVVIFLLCVFSLSISRIDLSFTDALGIIWNHVTGDVPSRTEDYSEWWVDQVVINDNVPRTIAGVCVGGILAVAGAVMQSVTRNPLTDPYTLGISSAALFGTTVFVIFGFCIVPGLEGATAQVVNAFIIALIPAMAIVAVSGFKRLSPNMMILIGIAMMYMFGAFTTFLKFNADAQDLEEIYEWGLGTLVDVGWDSILPLVSTLVMLMLIMVFLAPRINVLGAGDKTSLTLGVNPRRLRALCFLLIAMGTAVAVCFTGSIGFVGLVAPHVARLFVGSNNRALIPASAITGALLVVGSDCIVRMLPTVLPVGVVTALVGSPLFLYFLYMQRKKSSW